MRELLAPHAPRVVALAERLRKLVQRTIPDIEERVYVGWRAIGYRHVTAGYFCAIFPARDHVALAFEFGVQLSDPEGILRPGRTSGKRVRYVEILAAHNLRVRPIASLLKQAIALRGSLHPPSRSVRVRSAAFGRP